MHALPSQLSSSAVIAVATLLHFAYLFVTPFDLSPDEAHYWDWSRNLDWCYYSKGPLVAWLIRASCELFGHSAVAVRIPAVACHALLIAALATLSNRRTLLLALTLPPVSATAFLMTIDAPLLAAWAWALVFVRRERWLAAGACVAVGVLAKYTMLLFPACVGFYLLAVRPQSLRERGYWLMLAVGLLGTLPILAWNFAHGGLGVRHVATQAGVAQGWHWLGPLEFVGSQFVLLAGVWFCAGCAAVRKYPRDAEDRYFWWITVPVVAIVFAASFATRTQPNWAAPAYLTGFILAVRWLDAQPARFGQTFIALGVGVGVAASAFAHFPSSLRPLLATLAPPPCDADPAPVRKLDPTSRLMGWRHLASEVDAIRTRVETDTGIAPQLAAMVWTTPGELGFYARGTPQVYSFGTALADRTSQYDVWRPNPIADAQAFRGQTFVYVGEVGPNLLAAFDRIDPPAVVVYRENGVPLASWKVRVCWGFRGFPELPPARY